MCLTLDTDQVWHHQEPCLQLHISLICSYGYLSIFIKPHTVFPVMIVSLQQNYSQTNMIQDGKTAYLKYIDKLQCCRSAATMAIQDCNV